MHTRQEKMEAFGRLLDVMDDLREKCPWDRSVGQETDQRILAPQHD